MGGSASACRCSEQLFDNMPHGVIVLDGSVRVVVYNAAEEALAGRRRARVLGRDFFVEIAPYMNVRELAGELRTSIGHKTIDARGGVLFSVPACVAAPGRRGEDAVVRLGRAPFGFFLLRGDL